MLARRPQWQALTFSTHPVGHLDQWSDWSRLSWEYLENILIQVTQKYVCCPFCFNCSITHNIHINQGKSYATKCLESLQWLLRRFECFSLISLYWVSGEKGSLMQQETPPPPHHVEERSLPPLTIRLIEVRTISIIDIQVWQTNWQVTDKAKNNYLFLQVNCRWERAIYN